MKMYFNTKPRFHRPLAIDAKFIGSLMIFGKYTDLWYCHRPPRPVIQLRAGNSHGDIRIYEATLEAAHRYDPRIQRLIVYTMF